MESSQLVTILRYGGIGCLVLAALLLALAILLFFRLQIREIRDELSGRARKNAIIEMGENYSTTGTLRTISDEIAAAQDEKNGLMNTGQLDSTGKKPGKKKTKQDASAVQKRPVPPQPGSGSEATDVLTRRPPQKPPAVSAQKLQRQPPAQQPSGDLTGQRVQPANAAFRITREIILVHTDDQIS